MSTSTAAPIAPNVNGTVKDTPAANTDSASSSPIFVDRVAALPLVADSLAQLSTLLNYTKTTALLQSQVHTHLLPVLSGSATVNYYGNSALNYVETLVPAVKTVDTEQAIKLAKQPAEHAAQLAKDYSTLVQTVSASYSPPLFFPLLPSRLSLFRALADLLCCPL